MPKIKIKPNFHKLSLLISTKFKLTIRLSNQLKLKLQINSKMLKVKKQSVTKKLRFFSKGKVILTGLNLNLLAELKQT